MADETPANKLRGEFTLESEGKGLRLVIDVNGLCIAEDMLDASASEFIARLAKGDLRTIRAVLFAATRTFHPEFDVKDAGDIIAELSPVIIAEKLIGGIASAFPKPGASEGGARPTRKTNPRAKATAPA